MVECVGSSAVTGNTSSMPSLSCDSHPRLLLRRPELLWGVQKGGRTCIFVWSKLRREPSNFLFPFKLGLDCCMKLKSRKFYWAV
jgi:hypothetical protein